MRFFRHARANEWYWGPPPVRIKIAFRPKSHPLILPRKSSCASGGCRPHKQRRSGRTPPGIRPFPRRTGRVRQRLSSLSILARVGDATSMGTCGRTTDNSVSNGAAGTSWDRIASRTGLWEKGTRSGSGDSALVTNGLGRTRISGGSSSTPSITIGPPSAEGSRGDRIAFSRPSHPTIVVITSSHAVSTCILIAQSSLVWSVSPLGRRWPARSGGAAELPVGPGPLMTDRQGTGRPYTKSCPGCFEHVSDSPERRVRSACGRDIRKGRGGS